MKRREFLANAALAFALTVGAGKIEPVESQEEIYGRSPSSTALPDIKTLNSNFSTAMRVEGKTLDTNFVQLYERNVETLLRQKRSRLRDCVRR